MTSNTPDSNEPSIVDLRGSECGSGTRDETDANYEIVSANCLKWAENVHELLNDPKGMELFENYLLQEDIDRFHMLKFWYACRGIIMQRHPKTIDQAVRVIYKQLFVKIKSGIRDEVKSAVARQMVARNSRSSSDEDVGFLTAAIYSDACRIVEKEIYNVMYPNFLNSDVYLNCVQRMQQGDQCSSLDSSNREAPALPEEQEDELPITSQPLPTVDEDKVLSLDVYQLRNKSRFPSSKSSLHGKLATPGSMVDAQNVPHSRLGYYSYTQNSELQSESSGGRTDSLVDLTLDDTVIAKHPYVQQRHIHSQMQLANRLNINRNVEDENLIPFIPRTLRPDITQKTKPQQPNEFAAELVVKLEQLKLDRDNQELLAKKLNSIDFDEEDQDILDKHVKRIFSPEQSPSVGTPVRPKSPDGHRMAAHGSNRHVSRNTASSPYVGIPGHMKPRSKDLYSVFSVDSGNYTDPTEEAEYSRRSVSKYKEHGSHPSSNNFGGHLQRTNRSWSNSRRTLTDSGVSENEYSSYREASGSCRDRDRIGHTKETSYPPTTVDEKSLSSRHRARSTSGYTGRSTCRMSDRLAHGSGGNGKRGLPLHPFVQDPKLPPFQYHNYPSELSLEEAARRLRDNEDDRHLSSCAASTRSSHFVGGISKADLQQMHKSSTLGRQSHRSYAPSVDCEETTTSRGKTPGAEETVYTNVLYNFSDEEMPYLLKVPGNPITLKLFKEYMPPKKVGQYRFFFVKPCEDLGNQPIQEEIVEDNEILPLWKGKVNAKIKAIE